MGNRSQHIKKKQINDFYIKTVCVGKKGDYEVQVMSHLFKLGVLRNDNFSEWIRETIRYRYPQYSSPSFEAELLMQKIMLIQQRIKSLANERETLQLQLKDLGFSVDMIEGKLVSLSEAKECSKTCGSDTCQNACSDKKDINKFCY